MGPFSVAFMASGHFKNLDFDDTAILHALRGDIRQPLTMSGGVSDNENQAKGIDHGATP